MTDDHAATKALPDDLLAYMRSHIKAQRDDLDGFLAIGNEVHRAATYDRWLAALVAPAAPVAQPVSEPSDQEIADAWIDVLATTPASGCHEDGVIPHRFARAILALRPAAPRATLTDGQILSAIRTIGLPNPMGLTRDVGPYEVTEPTHYLRLLVRAVIAEFCRVNGIGQEGGV